MKKRARNIFLRLSYDGTRYHGFQRQVGQKQKIIAVQNILEERAQLIFGDEIEMAAAGRTDTGVHALGQAVNFFTDGKIPLARIKRALNNVLPRDIVIKEVREAKKGFSARHNAGDKSYIYRIYQGRERNPFLANYAWHIPETLSLAKIEEAGEFLLGEHDFSSFRAADGKEMSAVRTLKDFRVEEEDEELVFYFKANGFLYHMVRNMMALLVAVGLGKKTVDSAREIFLKKDRGLVPPTAPAAGLYLASVDYAEEWFLESKVVHS